MKRMPRVMRGESGVWIGLAAAAVVLLALAFFLLPGALVGDEIRDQAARAKARNDARTSSIQLVGAMVVAVGLILTARTYLLNRQGQLTDRFSRAVDQLGHDAAAIRLGGVYALAQLGVDAGADLRGQIRAVLAAFVRQRAPWPARRQRADAKQPEADVQAALTTLGRCAPPKAEEGLDLSSTDLRGADLRGAQLQRATLAESHLEWATLKGACLDGAVLTQAHLERADLTKALLPGAKLHATIATGAVFVKATLTDAELDGAVLIGADLAGAKGANVLPAVTDDTTTLP